LSYLNKIFPVLTNELNYNKLH